MKTTDIYKALQITKPKGNEKAHAKTICDIFAMFKEIASDAVQVNRNDCPFMFGHEMSGYGRYDQEPRESEKGKEFPGTKLTVQTNSGSYAVSIPNAILFEFAQLFPSFNLHVQPDFEVDKAAADLVIYFDKILTSEIKKAAKFIKFDSLDNPRNYVHVSITAGRCEVFGTDGYKLYRSGYLSAEGLADAKFMLPITELKTAAIKDALTVCLFKEGDKFTKGTINGVYFEAPEYLEFLNYTAVFPTYYDFVEFDVKEFTKLVKGILPYANKATSEIKLNFNGAIIASAEDLDWSHETSSKIDYLQKTAGDFQIAFNGKYLLQCLAACESKTARLYSEGDAKKCAVIDDKILLMPTVTASYE